MVETIHATEEVSAYPPAPDGLSDAALALDADMIWQRIEQWVAHRWSERTATWLVHGPGEWVPPLTPATITDVEVWRHEVSGAGYVAATAPPSPFGGLEFSEPGPWRITAIVGAAPVPPAAQEAFRRLAEYSAAEAGVVAASQVSRTEGDLTESYSRNAAWMAKAMQNSGAADLLRPYRRA